MEDRIQHPMSKEGTLSKCGTLSLPKWISMGFDKLNELPLNGYRGDYRDQNKKTLTHKHIKT
jgi:hypothetical protein